MLSDSIKLANSVYRSDDRPLLEGWRGHPGGRGLRVFPVVADDLERSELATVAPGGEMIMVSDACASVVEERLGGALEGDMEVPVAQALAVVLLHEVGHVIDRPVSLKGPLAAVASQLRAEQVNELLADVRAAELIRASGNLDLELTVMHAQWNLFHRRMRALPINPDAREHYVDDELGHPNLELRMLTVAYVIRPSSASLEMLLRFVRRREEPEPASTPLFRLYPEAGN